MSMYDTFRRRLDEGRALALVGVIAGPSIPGDKLLVYRDGTWEGAFPVDGLTAAAVPPAAHLLRLEQAGAYDVSVATGTFRLFADVYPIPPHLVVIGATQTAEPLAQIARVLGFRVTIADARGAFAVPERFPAADEVLKGWPQDVLPGIPIGESTYVVLLSHDPKFDEPTLQHVLPTRAPYIGAIGSRKTQRERFERLRAQGFSEEQLARVYGPVGLDLGGRSAEETALAIMAEITAVRYGAGAGYMRERR